jgi:hypothetical protein
MMKPREIAYGVALFLVLAFLTFLPPDRQRSDLLDNAQEVKAPPSLPLPAQQPRFAPAYQEREEEKRKEREREYEEQRQRQEREYRELEKQRERDERERQQWLDRERERQERERVKEMARQKQKDDEERERQKDMARRKQKDDEELARKIRERDKAINGGYDPATIIGIGRGNGGGRLRGPQK